MKHILTSPFLTYLLHISPDNIDVISPYEGVRTKIRTISPSYFHTLFKKPYITSPVSSAHLV